MKANKKALMIVIAAIALVLCVVIILLNSCSATPSQGGVSSGDTSSTTSEGVDANGVGTGNDSLDTDNDNTAEDPEREGQKYSKPATQYDKYESAEASVYDIKATSFNVGNWWWGVGQGIPEDQPGGMDAWAYAYEHMNADIYGLQEMYPVMYTFQNTTVLPEDYWSSKFYYKSTAGDIRWRNLKMYNGFLSRHELNNYSYGYVGDAHPTFNRLYTKAYITIGEVKVAVFSFHTSPSEDSAKARVDQINEIAEILSKEDYFIAMGDFNTPVSADYDAFRKAGYNIANHGQFGAISTYYYSENPIDNIVTSSNIKINKVYREQFLGASDHWPLSAELTIVPGEKKVYNKPATDSDGYTSDWYLK